MNHEGKAIWYRVSTWWLLLRAFHRPRSAQSFSAKVRQRLTRPARGWEFRAICHMANFSLLIFRGGLLPSSRRWSAALALVGPAEVALGACAGKCASTRSADRTCPRQNCPEIIEANRARGCAAFFGHLAAPTRGSFAASDRACPGTMLNPFRRA